MGENLKDKFKNIPLNELLKYREALIVIIDKYEKNLMPMYGMASQFDRRTPLDTVNNNQLVKAQGYLKAVLELIEEKTYNELDNYENTVKTPLKTNKSTITKTNKTTKSKTSSKL